MIGDLWRHNRALAVLTAAVCIGALAGLVGLVVIAFTKGEEPSPSSRPVPAASTPAQPEGSAAVTPAPDGESGTSREDVAKWAGENDSRFPAAGTSSAFPELSAKDYERPESYVVAFTRQLLTVDYSSASRDELLSWVRWEAAPPPSGDPSVDADAVTLVLLSFLEDPPSSTAPMIVDPTEWEDFARAGVTQSVDGLTVTPNAAWEEMKADGYLPPDPNTVCMDVSATVSRQGGTAGSESNLRFTMCTGTPVEHSGYGYAGIADVKAMAP